MKVKDLVSVIDFSKNKWLNVGYFDEQNKFVTIMEHCEDEIYIEKGSGRNKGRLGALVCNYKGNLVNVGSGFSDEDRELFWKNKDEIIGRIIEVRYKEVTKDKKTELESLQFPSYLGVRENGKEESYN